MRAATPLHRAARALLRLPRAGAWGLCLAWYALICGLSSRPGSVEPSHWSMQVLSNAAHAPLFGLLAAWIALLLPRRDGWPDLGPRGRAVLLGAIALLGALDELHQALTPGRDLSLFDLGTDLTGAAATLHIVAGLTRAGARVVPRLGLAACASFVAGACATFVPRCFPDVAWF